MAQYVLRLTDSTGQPLNDAGTAFVSELFTGAPVASSAVDVRGFTDPFALTPGILYAVETASAVLPTAILQPSLNEIISVTPASAKRAAAIVGNGVAGVIGGPDYVTFVQASPTSVWTITHSLGHLPVVATIDTNEDEMIGEVDYPSLTSVVITFSEPVAGTATLV